ncbi:MAG: hypothetical protein J0M17_15815, partial [Planctomycetes bacterium]|nr:hypothetical protein [Planctomycetota bacterium]
MFLALCLAQTLPLMPTSTAVAHEVADAPSQAPSTVAGSGFSDPAFDAFSTADSEVRQTAHSAPATSDDDDGIRLDALEKKFNDFVAGSKATTYPTIKINGVFQADFGWVQQDANSTARYGHIKDGADFRRARLAASGAITEVNNYFLQMDFGFFGRPTFTDVWVEQTDLPILGNVRVGQWKQPFSLEVVSSFRYTTFAERSVLFQAFDAFRHLGAGFYNRNDELTATWAASVFAFGQDQFGGSIATAGGVGTAERFTYLPYYDEPSDGRYYLHTGVGHYFSAPNDKSVNFRTIPEMYIGAFNQAASAPNQQPVPTTVSGIEASFGSVLFAGNYVPSGPATVAVWDDPNDDGDPSDCVLLGTATATINPGSLDTDVLQTFLLASSVTANGYIFIGASVQHTAAEFPAPVDQAASACGGAAGNSWFAGNSAPTADLAVLTNNSAPPQTLAGIGITGNWLLRPICGPVVTGTPYCFGDGTGTACPCGNVGAAGNGCGNSLNANGANLAATGSAVVGGDSVVLTGTGMPNSSALYFQGTSQISVVFGDGLRCA